MGELFLKVLNMSIAASWLILAVLLLRFVLKRAPKWAVVLLWGIVALRLAVPFSFESVLSLIPSAETFNAHNIQYETPAVNSGIASVNNAVNPVLGEAFAPNPAGSVNPLHVWMFIVSVIWLVGVAAMLLYAVISYVRVRRSVAERVPYAGNIFLCDHVKSPFILGLVLPKIYLPSDMDAAAMESVIAHEKAHLARRDHWWKPLGFLILTLHWFNPLCWIAYVLLCRDIESACDEKVIRQMDLDGKKQYSATLLECSTGRRLVTICPLAFGETGVKERVKNVLNYKKPSFWIISVAVIACIAVAVCFLTNPVTAEPDAPNAAGTALPTAEPGTPPENDAVDGQKLTLDDVIMLSQKGSALTWSDFAPYQGREVGSGLYIMRYGIDEVFDVLVGGVPDETPMYIDLRANNGAGDSIDIRTENVSAFIEAHRNDVPEEPELSTLFDEQTAIRQAILMHNRASNPRAYDADCCSFVTLETVSGTPLAGSSTHKITYYVWAKYDALKLTGRNYELCYFSYDPVVISFDLDERDNILTYTLTDYWDPRDGSDYEQDIREKFPAHLVEDCLDRQKYSWQLGWECYAQVIEPLIEMVSSRPILSNQWSYHNDNEYRELTYYGWHTLRYCFDRFEKGGETGLPGYVMMWACKDIADDWGEDPLVFFMPMDEVLTGQAWYDAFKSNALTLKEQYSEKEFSKIYPASYALLGLLGEI